MILYCFIRFLFGFYLIFSTINFLIIIEIIIIVEIILGVGPHFSILQFCRWLLTFSWIINFFPEIPTDTEFSKSPVFVFLTIHVFPDYQRLDGLLTIGRNIDVWPDY